MKTVLITGVGKGIGKALAEKFLSENWFVLGTHHTTELLPKENLLSFPLELSSPQNIVECAQAIRATGRKISIFINNAGVLLDDEETEVRADKLRETLEVNLTGTVALTEELLPLIEENSHIINISSTAGSIELSKDGVSHYPNHYPAYKISKAALNMYTRTLAVRMESKDITVSSVHPGWVKTDMGGEEADITPQEAAKDIYDFAITHPETGQFWFKGEKLLW